MSAHANAAAQSSKVRSNPPERLSSDFKRHDSAATTSSESIASFSHNATPSDSAALSSHATTSNAESTSDSLAAACLVDATETQSINSSVLGTQTLLINPNDAKSSPPTPIFVIEGNDKDECAKSPALVNTEKVMLRPLASYCEPKDHYVSDKKIPLTSQSDSTSSSAQNNSRVALLESNDQEPQCPQESNIYKSFSKSQASLSGVVKENKKTTSSETYAQTADNLDNKDITNRDTEKEYVRPRPLLIDHQPNSQTRVVALPCLNRASTDALVSALSPASSSSLDSLVSHSSDDADISAFRDRLALMRRYYSWKEIPLDFFCGLACDD